jgi:hypothetical protein
VLINDLIPNIIENYVFNPDYAIGIVRRLKRATNQRNMDKSIAPLWFRLSFEMWLIYSCFGSEGVLLFHNPGLIDNCGSKNPDGA